VSAVSVRNKSFTDHALLITDHRYLQAGLLALLTFASLPIRYSEQWHTTGKGAYSVFSESGLQRRDHFRFPRNSLL